MYWAAWGHPRIGQRHGGNGGGAALGTAPVPGHTAAIVCRRRPHRSIQQAEEIGRLKEKLKKKK